MKSQERSQKSLTVELQMNNQVKSKASVELPLNFKKSLLVDKYSQSVIAKAKEVVRSLVPSCGMPLYSSIDLRDSGSRLVAVDVNLFPAGFNNLSEESILNSSEGLKVFLEKKLKKKAPWKVGLVPESHTNNEGYLQNLLALKKMILMSGAEFKLAWSGIPIPKEWNLKTSQFEVLYHPMNDVIEWSDIILLNHDLSGGPLQALEFYSKPIYPNPELGWYKRRKSEHFDIARKVLTRISKQVPEIDPSDFIAESISLENINLESKDDLKKLMDASEGFFKSLQESYKVKGREEAPFVYLKNDSGTYGLGVWSFSSLEELRDSISILKKKFARGKQSTRVSRFILQEGISTRLTLNEGKEHIESEPVIYSVNGTKVGSFFRFGISDTGNGGQENLNKPGAWFEEQSRYPEDYSKMLYLYDFVATLHSISAALEDCPCS